MKLMKDEEEEQHQLHYLGFSIHQEISLNEKLAESPIFGTGTLSSWDSAMVS